MKRTVLYAISIMIVVSCSCHRQRDWMRVDDTPQANSLNDYDHEGRYSGCPPRYSGTLTTEVMLYNNVYRVIRTFSIPNESKCFECEGSYTRSGDGGRIELHGDVTPSSYIIGKDILIPLDDNGNPYIAAERIFCLERAAR